MAVVSLSSSIGRLSPWFLALLVALLLLLYSGFCAVINHRRLRQFDGPRLASFSRLWLFWQSINANLPQAQWDALQAHGCPARIGPDLLVIDDPDMIRHFNAAGSRWRRSRWYDAMRLDPRLDTVFSTRNEKIHADLKSKEAGAYSGRDVDTLESDIDARITDLVDLIRNEYAGRRADVAEIMRYFTLDVLSTVAFGRPFGFMAANTDLWSFGAANSGFMGVLELTSLHKSVHWILSTPLMQWALAPKPTDATGFGPALAFAQKAVAERFAPEAKAKGDMLGHFVQKGLSQLRCESEAFLQIIAGSDATTTVLRCTMYLLASHPAAYARLRDEIDAATADGALGPPGSIVSNTAAQRLPYLSAVLWEGIRMYPPLFGLKSKIAPPGGETVCGVYFPEGTEVCICDSAMTRSKVTFGDDAHLFRPGRWLEADFDTYRRYMRVVDTVFASGRFLCLGRHIALMELHKTYVELMRNFDWAIASPLDGVKQISHGIHTHIGMNMVARPRDPVQQAKRTK